MTPRSSWEDIAPLPSWQKYIEEILNKKYGPIAIQEKTLPPSHPGKKKDRTKNIAHCYPDKKFETKNKKYYLTAVLSKIYLKYIGQNCGPSAMLAKGKVRDEGSDHDHAK